MTARSTRTSRVVLLPLLLAALVASTLTWAPAPAEAANPSSCSSIRLIAHRGMVDRSFTENTVRALKHSVARGARTLEVDLRLTADGRWMLMHDRKVDRVTNGSGRIRDLTSTQVKALRTNDGTVGGVPALWQALSFLKKRPAVRLQLEIKSYDASDQALQQIITTTEQYGVKKRVSFSSFGSTVLLHLRELDPSVRTGVLTWSRLTVQQVQRLGQRVLLSIGQLTPAYVAAMHRAHLTVDTWTVNAKAGWKRAVRAGVDTITTNASPKLRQFCRRS